MSLRRIGKELNAATEQTRYSLVSPQPVNLSSATARMITWEFSCGSGQIHVLEGVKITVDFKMPKEYPFKAPDVEIGLTESKGQLYHPNVDMETGKTCLPILKQDWQVSKRMTDVLDAIADILVNPDPASALNVEAAELYCKDRTAYQSKAMDMLVSPEN